MVPVIPDEKGILCKSGTIPVAVSFRMGCILLSLAGKPGRRITRNKSEDLPYQ